MYTLRHPVTGQPERASETLKHATLSSGRARQFFNSQTFCGTKAELRSSPPDSTFREGCRRG